MSKTRDNHYVPEWYQRGFLFDNKKGKLRYLDLSPNKILLSNGVSKELRTLRWEPPSNCFYQKDLYTTFFGSHINDEIERYLFGNIDTLGSRALRAFSGNDYSDWHRSFRNFFSYIDAQKIRTPKGLQWIREHYPQLDQIALMREMQAIRNMHCTLWAEGVREIVSAKNSKTKFIVSDHPVTVYNPAYPLDSNMCAYPNDPSIALKGTQTIFPLNMDHCLILTNYEYAKAPDTESPVEKRTNPGYFRNSLVSTVAFIKSRLLDEEEVIKINFLIKSRVRRFVGAAKEEWLYPERRVNLKWAEIGKVLLPPQDDLYQFGGEIYASYEDGSTRYQDAFGRTQPENKYLKKPKRTTEPGRNDPCGCGSAYKYKKCCLGKPLSQRPTWEELSIRERNIIFANRIIEILRLDNNKTWEDVRRELSNEQVKDIHKLYGSLWPRETDFIKLLPKPDRSLRALYTGIVDPRTIGSSVCSLIPYFDEILIQNPFLPSWLMRKEYSPINNSHQHKLQTLRNIALFLSLAPFINAGYINLFPDPCAFNSYLFEQRRIMAKERVQHSPVSTTDERVPKENIFWMMPKDIQKQRIHEALPHLTGEQIDQLLEYIAQKKQDDPFSLLHDNALGEEGGQILVTNMSPNFEMSLYLAQATGSLLVTDSNYRWSEIITAQNKTEGLVTHHWSGLTDLIKSRTQTLSGDEKNAFALRRSSKLRDLRRSIGNIYNAALATEAPDSNALDRLKYGFENACTAASSGTGIGDDNSFKVSFNCLIPQGGIVHNNVQRMLLSSGVENYLRSVPMAIFIKCLENPTKQMA